MTVSLCAVLEGKVTFSRLISLLRALRSSLCVISKKLMFCCRMSEAFYINAYRRQHIYCSSSAKYTYTAQRPFLFLGHPSRIAWREFDKVRIRLLDRHLWVLKDDLRVFGMRNSCSEGDAVER
jgi:hypothetical protein